MAAVSPTGSSTPLVDALNALWCELMHDSLMWPIHSQYQCRTCGRQYMVPWALQSGRASQANRQVFTNGVQLASMGRS